MNYERGLAFVLALLWAGLCPGTLAHTEDPGRLTENPARMVTRVNTTFGSMEKRPPLGSCRLVTPESGRSSERRGSLRSAWLRNTVIVANTYRALCARHTSKNFPCTN